MRRIVRARASVDDESVLVCPSGPEQGQVHVSYKYVEAQVESGDFLRARPNCSNAVFVDGPNR